MIEQDSFTGFLHSSTRQRFISGLWSRRLGSGWRLTAAGGRDAYAQTTDVGFLALTTLDQHASAHLDGERVVGAV